MAFVVCCKSNVAWSGRDQFAIGCRKAGCVAKLNDLAEVIRLRHRERRPVCFFALNARPLSLNLQAGEERPAGRQLLASERLSACHVDQTDSNLISVARRRICCPSPSGTSSYAPSVDSPQSGFALALPLTSPLSLAFLLL